MGSLNLITSGTQDPRVVATFGKQGSLFLRTTAIGLEMFQKQDSGLSINWIKLVNGAEISLTGLGECIDDNDALKAAIAAKKAAPATAVENTGVTANLQALINAAVDGDVIEIQSNGVYGAITIPSGVGMTLRAGTGFLPVFTAANAVTLSNGTRDLYLIGLKFLSCTTADANGRGSAICMAHLAIVQNIYVSNCQFVSCGGSSVLLAYHQTFGGDNYVNPYSTAELSQNFNSVDNYFLRASTDVTEGAAFQLRGFSGVVVRRNYFDAGDGTAGTANEGKTRGCLIQSSRGTIIQDSVATNAWLNTSGSGEGFKLDNLAAPTDFTASARIERCASIRNRKGFVVDDNYTGTIVQSLALDNFDAGFNFRKATTSGVLDLSVGVNNKYGLLIEAAVPVGVVSVDCSLMNNNFSADYSLANGQALDTQNLSGSRPVWYNYLYQMTKNYRLDAAAAVTLIPKSDMVVEATSVGGTVNLFAGYNKAEVYVYCPGGATIVPDGAETIKGAANLPVAAGASAHLFFYNGDWKQL